MELCRAAHRQSTGMTPDYHRKKVADNSLSPLVETLELNGPQVIVPGIPDPHPSLIDYQVQHNFLPGEPLVTDRLTVSRKNALNGSPGVAEALGVLRDEVDMDGRHRQNVPLPAYPVSPVLHAIVAFLLELNHFFAPIRLP
jgi:hypothetical protein